MSALPHTVALPVLSVTPIVNSKVCSAALEKSVPSRTPLAALITSPGGRFPVAGDHAEVGVHPVTPPPSATNKLPPSTATLPHPK